MNHSCETETIVRVCNLLILLSRIYRDECLLIPTIKTFNFHRYDLIGIKEERVVSLQRPSSAAGPQIDLSRGLGIQIFKCFLYD